jgi:hypothetical protein
MQSTGGGRMKKQQYLTGKEAVSIYQTTPFQLIKLMRKNMLHAVTESGKKVYDTDIHAPDYPDSWPDPRPRSRSERKDRRKKEEGHIKAIEALEPTFRQRIEANRRWAIHKMQLDRAKGRDQKPENDISMHPDGYYGISLNLPQDEEKAKEKLNEMLTFYFERSELDKLFNKTISSVTPSEETTERDSRVIPCKPGTKWDDIKITLIDDHNVRIEVHQSKDRYHYSALKMADQRDGKPSMLWELLKIFAKNEGFITSKFPEYDPRFPDTAKRLNKHMKQLFGISGSIYQGHYKTMKGYKTKIFFSDQTKVVS